MDATLTLNDIVVIVISILIGMTVHEATHAFVSNALGDDTAAQQGRISFNPLRHIDPFSTVLLPIITLVLFQAPLLAARPVPFNPHRVRFGEYGAALIAAAGPLANLVLAFIAAVLLHLVIGNADLAQALYTFITLNVALGIFNLVPIPPLDGSRVLYAFAPEAVQDVMAQLEPYGLFIIFALVLWTGASGILANIESGVLQLLLW